MFKKIIVVIIIGIVLGGCNLAQRKAGIEIMAYPTAKVFIDGKEAGMTPYKNSSLKPVETEIKLTANNLNFVKKIKLQNNINTVVDWEFGKGEKDSGGYVLYMEKTGDEKRAGLLINTDPNKAAVTVEGEIKGFSPTKIEEIGEGDEQVIISFPTYKTINVFVKALKGYQLVIDAKLAQEEMSDVKSMPADENTSADPANNVQQIIILPTETGWLRVREAANGNAGEIAKIKPKEKYNLLEESNEWYKIDLGNGKIGWISAKYAEKSQ